MTNNNGGPEMTEPTTAEALAVTRALHDAAATISVAATSGIVLTGTLRGVEVAAQCRVAADFLETMHKATTPGILRRRADQLDPPAVPAAPDLTTPEGWRLQAALAANEVERMPLADQGYEMGALWNAWDASVPGSVGQGLFAQVYMRSQP